MNRELVTSALKSSCGNNLDFQVTLQNSQLHIYVSRSPEHYLNYFLLKDNVTSTVASLYGEFETVWLYSYLAGETKPEWQTLIEKTRSSDCDEDEDDTIGRRQLNHHTDPALIPNTNDFTEDDIDDTELLRDTGMVHACTLSEFDLVLDTLESPTVLQIANYNLEDKILAQSLVAEEMLTNSKIVPKREVKLLVISFHHLAIEDKYQLLPILDNYFHGGRINDLKSVVSQQWFERVKKLDPRDRRLLAIWLTRYCLSPRATLSKFEAARDVMFVECDLAIDREVLPQQEDSTSVKSDKSSQRSKLFFFKLTLAGICIVATAVLIGLRIFSNIAPAKDNPVCNDTISSLDYCR